MVGAWTGSTSQNRPFYLLANGDGIVLAVISWSAQGASCTSGVVSLISREPPGTPIPLSNGAFTINSPGSTSTVNASGSLAPSGSASGTLSVTDTRCQGTMSGTWTATKATGPEVTLTGTWRGSFQSSLVPRTDGTFTLSQNGAALSGTYTLVNGASGTLSGTVGGRMITFTLTQNTAGCAGTFTGHGTLMPAPETLLLFYSGTDCLGLHTGGTGSGIR